MTESRPDFTELPDLASRRLGGSVVAASDELFAEKENLIKPGAPVFAPGEFGNRGKIYDGGVARFRVHGTALPDPRFLAGTIDLAAAEHGGRVIGCSDAFYSSAGNLILPGRAVGMGEGWENARRRGPGHDYVIIALAAAGQLRHVEIDTSWFVGNAPGWVRLLAAHRRGALAGPPPEPGPPSDPRLPGPGSPWRERLPLAPAPPP